MEWVMTWNNKGYWMTLRDDRDFIVARYLDDRSGYYRVMFVDPRIDAKEELIRLADISELDLQTYIKNKYLLLRSG